MRQDDDRGSLPFAAVAVAILLISVIVAATSAGYEISRNNADNVEREMDSIDSAIQDITLYVNRGLGEIILDISKDDNLGSLEQRAEVYQKRAMDWLKFQFPISYGGATARMMDAETSLISIPMEIASESGMDGYTPTYLKGNGTVSVNIRSQASALDTDLRIDTDGSYALPLVAERGSLFESMIGGKVSLAQMMTYQLTSLAEYRILNGYGAKGYSGTRGTDRILTAEDVEEALRICSEAIDAICFRDDDNILVGQKRADLSDMLIANDGRASIDLSAVYAQSLISAVDDIVLRWEDYFYGFEVAEALESVFNPLREPLRILNRYLSGEERVSGIPYLKAVMESNGYPADDYERPGSGITTVDVGGFFVSIDNPTSSVFDLPELRSFKRDYDSSGNYIEEYVLGILRNAAVKVSENSGLGTVTIDVDPYDDKGFLESILDVYRSSAAECHGILEESIRDSLGESEVYDEFYGRMADIIMSRSDSFHLESELSSRIRSSLSAQISAKIAWARQNGVDYIAPDIDALMASPAVIAAISAYTRSVEEGLRTFDVLREVTSGKGNIVKSVMTEICGYGLELLGILAPIDQRALDMVEEIAGINGTNPYGGVIDLPDTDRFDLNDEHGNRMIETISSVVDIDGVYATVRTDAENCIHTVGFRENRSAAYSTEFVVNVRGTVLVSLTGSSSFSNAMGTTTSQYTQTVPVDAIIHVTVASGWPLAGIEYEPSTTVIEDLWDIILEALEPIIEPLREILEMLRGAMTVLSETVMRAIGFASEYLVELYNTVMGPLESLKGMLEDAVESAITDTVFDTLVKIGLKDQSLSFRFFGCMLTFTTSAITWKSNTKTLLTTELTVPVADISVNAGVTVKVRGEMKSSNLLITGFGGLTAEDWNVKAKIDPLMKSSKYLISFDGDVGKTSFSFTAPKLEDYYEMGIALSDVPGLGEVLNNIPIPLLGVNVGLDAGFSLKYGMSSKPGLVINEFETNPKGEDRNNEWVELYNNGPLSVDLTGYSLEASGKGKTMALEGTLSPGEYMVVHPTFTLVNDKEKLRIRDENGDVVDDTPSKSDSTNDDLTWQRKYDAATEWVFAPSTKGARNASMLGHIITAKDMKDCVWSAVEKSFGKVEYITDMETLSEFVQYLVRYTLEGLIDTVSGLLIEASVYASIDLKDMTSSVSSGIRVALRTDGELVKDCFRYVAGQLESVLLGMKNPYKIDPTEMFAENIDLEVTFHAGIGFPKMLKGDVESLPQMDLGVVVRVNLASLTRVIGSDTGTPGIQFGILARDCPEIVIPSKLSPKDGMNHDLWLFVATVEFG